MINRLFFISILVLGLCFNESFAQTNKELVFNVSKQKTDLEVFPKYDFLIYNIPESISIKVDDENAELKLELAGGSVLIRENDTVLVAENLNGKGVLLKIYDISKGTDRLIKSISYDVIEPKLFLGNTDLSAGTINIKGLLNDSLAVYNFFTRPLELRANYKGEKITYEILSFELGCIICGDYKSLRVRGNLVDERIKELLNYSSCERHNYPKPIERRFYFEKMTTNYKTDSSHVIGNAILKLTK
jgi:hypothetical protein